MVYRAGPPGSTRIVPLDSLTAIFHRASGQTHIVSEPVPQILEALAQKQGDVAALLDRLGLDDTMPTRTLLTVRLDELLQTGLVSRT